MTHIVKYGGPAFHGDALEYSEQGKQDVVKLGDPVVGADPGEIATGVTGRALPEATGELHL